MVPRKAALPVVRRLLSDPDLLARCAPDLDELDRHTMQSSTVGESRYSWSWDDTPLVDEAVTAIHGPPEVYDHVVVDEAQDLSPMQWLVLRRRTRGTGLTVTGDLAQATGVTSPESWVDVADRAGVGTSASYEELLLGYRVPREVMEFAGRLLPYASLYVGLPRSFRSFEAPKTVPTNKTNLLAAAAEAAGAAALRGGSVAVICEPGTTTRMKNALERQGVEAEVVQDRYSKGLEYDHTVVVEPAEIARDGRRGSRRLYICLTRCTKTLTVVHAQPLPAALLVAPSGDVGTQLKETSFQQLKQVYSEQEAAKIVYPNSYKRWSPQEELDLRARVGAGFPVEDIADLHKRRPSSIRARIKKLGLSLK